MKRRRKEEKKDRRKRRRIRKRIRTEGSERSEAEGKYEKEEG
jgi:hypothetical protein